MAANRWDHSNILLSNQAGSIMGAGIADVGRNFGRGIERYYERKRQTEKEEATVEWLNQNEAAVNQLFPQLAQVKDPAERKKVIKAGIKGAGLENLVQVQSFMEQSAIRERDMAAQEEMVRLRRAQAEREAAAMEREVLARRRAFSPGIAEQVGAGASFRDLAPGSPTANTPEAMMATYVQAGGGDTDLLKAMMTSSNRERRPEPALRDFGTDASGRRVQGLVDAQGNVKHIEPPSEKGGEYERLRDKLESEGAFDVPVEKLTPRQKADFKRLDFLSTRGGGMTAEQMVAGIIGDGGGNQPSGTATAGEIPTVTPEEAAKLPKGTKFKTTDGRTLIKN